MYKNIEVLQEVLDLLEEEKRKFYNLVSQNDFKIEEINSYLRELSKNEEDDFKVFSPRNVESKHRDQIESDISEKKRFEEENVEYNKKIEALKLLISKVNVVIENIQTENERGEQEIGQNRKVVDKSNDETNRAESIVEEINNNIENVDMQRLQQKFTSEKQHIAHQILNCVSFITPDAERAKIELTALAEKITKY